MTSSPNFRTTPSPGFRNGSKLVLPKMMGQPVTYNRHVKFTPFFAAALASGIVSAGTLGGILAYMATRPPPSRPIPPAVVKSPIVWSSCEVEFPLYDFFWAYCRRENGQRVTLGKSAIEAAGRMPEIRQAYIQQLRRDGLLVESEPHEIEPTPELAAHPASEPAPSAIFAVPED